MSVLSLILVGWKCCFQVLFPLREYPRLGCRYTFTWWLDGLAIPLGRCADAN